MACYKCGRPLNGWYSLNLCIACMQQEIETRHNHLNQRDNEVRCECVSHCQITRRQERDRCAKIAKDTNNWAYPDGRAKMTALEIAKKIEEGDLT